MKLIKLLLGAMFFIALCGSGMMLTVLFLGFSDGHINTRPLGSLFICAGVFFTSSILLYYLSRTTPESPPSEISKKFKSRKLKLQLLAISLIIIFIVAIPFISSATNHTRLAASIISGLFWALRTACSEAMALPRMRASTSFYESIQRSTIN
jgi:glucose uptake protein GlcU